LYHRNVEKKQVRGRDKRRVEQSGTSEQKEVRGRDKQRVEKSGDHAAGEMQIKKLEVITHTRRSFRFRTVSGQQAPGSDNHRQVFQKSKISPHRPNYWPTFVEVVSRPVGTFENVGNSIIQTAGRFRKATALI
jgi:hypothetical protein